MRVDPDDGLPAPGRRIVLGRFDEVPGYRVLRPRGRPEWMLTLTLAGSGRFRVGRSEVVAEPGDLVVVPPAVPHDYAVRAGARHWEFHWAHAVIRPEWRPLLEGEGLHRIGVPPTHRDAVGTAFAEALAHRRTGRPVSDRLAMNCLERALLLVADARQAPSGVGPVVARVLEHVDTHLDGDLSVPALAEVAGMSPSRFAHVFAEQVGVPPQRHVERRRLDLAAELLDVSARPVAAVARAAGFADPLYFSRRFRRAHGLSPSAYRERAGRGTG
ncbi:helix-turn-helix domain-containing protein [Kineococcus rhizosphaerae]|uniref:AraC family transcriptional regulator of arabinose operon n=1 Tax=Kineococcus rhizosphaerae TaxID=559628 RepID=A0A2T0R0F1_9ACTN|nr:helix-turn-helix domain-containing protein [Kineococcus rhizosphaerae]PRY12597.1 AraC family transcriptional regulator of arabinose operon [Kineococcus rhizosphaerae]